VTIECAAAPRYTTAFGSPADRAVSVTFTAGKHIDKTVTVDRFERPVDNLWALAIGLDAVRLNELRGLDDVARQVYQMLPAPRQRSPWEVLGLPPNADEDVIDAVYRTKAKRLHPDVGGDVAAFQELQAAYEAVKHG
jgi:DnaJ-class molecular chaperone with C-terminal Zn finger domain